MKTPAAAVLALALAASPAWAQGPQEFQAHVLIVTSADDLNAWLQKPTDQQRGDAGRLRKVETGQKVYFPIVATGVNPPASGEMRLTADFELLTPTGEVAYGKKGMASAVITNRPDMHSVALGPVVDILVEAGDPKGIYRVKAVISDGTRSATATEAFRYDGAPEKPAAARPTPPRLNMDAPKKNPGKERDVRDCLTLPSPAEVIKCTEKR